MPKSNILLVDDDPQALESTRKILELSGYAVVTAGDGYEAQGQLRATHAGGSPASAKPRPAPFDLIITDVRMPRLGGLEFLKALSLSGDGTPVILMTAFGRVEEAVWAMKLGAVDFLTKPFKRQALLLSVEAALRRARARSVPLSESGAQAGAVRPGMMPQHDSNPDVKKMIGGAPSMRRLHSDIHQVAPTAASVLVTGESGTGKELVARLIHERSPRALSGKFIALNCAAVPENLIESELFGYEKGAFTGANGAREGLFEAAHEGTLFLDEIGDMPILLQTKLLRVLQEGEVRRVGSTSSRKVAVRVIAATHRDLKENVRAGLFRQDLLYRLEVVTLAVPPLRERLEDLPDLAYHFLREACARHGKATLGIHEEAMEALLSHHWPGNVRELSNVIERAVIFSQGMHLSVSELPAHLLRDGVAWEQAGDPHAISVPLGTPLREVEDLLIRKTLEATSGDKNMTAKLLGINSRTVYRKLGERSRQEGAAQGGVEAGSGGAGTPIAAEE